MKYISLFSGIEAASAAWMPLGWECVALSEVDPYCNAVLEERVPGVPNAGDIRLVDWRSYRGEADVVVGGSPCQSFSIAGKRAGLKGESGLMLDYIRAVQGIRPKCFLWENVPGALSSEGGEAFRCLLRAMDEVGYGMAWRVLDAQFFNLAQRRERVFLVGVLGDPARAAEVLFEPESLCWDHPQGRVKRQELAADARRGAAVGGGGNRPAPSSPIAALCRQAVAIQTAQTGSNGWFVSEELAHTLDCAGPEAVAFAQNTRDEVRLVGGDGRVAGALSASAGAKQQSYVLDGRPVSQYGDVAAALTARADSSPCADRGPTVVAFKQNASEQARLVGGDGAVAGTLVAGSRTRQTLICVSDDNANAAVGENLAGTLKTGGSPPWLSDGYVMRRLTPLECERLQGFPDNWTAVRFRGKPASDARRYRALGNSMAVPVVQWIGRRIEAALNGKGGA